MNACVLIIITAPSEQDAAAIGSTLVGERLAACATIIPCIRSIYWWNDRVHDATETMLLIKTRAELFEAVRQRVKALHTYEVPEITGIEIDRGDPAYLHWIEDSTREGD